MCIFGVRRTAHPTAALGYRQQGVRCLRGHLAVSRDMCTAGARLLDQRGQQLQLRSGDAERPQLLLQPVAKEGGHAPGQLQDLRSAFVASPFLLCRPHHISLLILYQYPDTPF